MLRAGKPIRITDVQRDLNLSSPSLAQYHLRKLVSLGLVREEQEGYVVEGAVVMHAFRWRRKLIPVQTAYVVFFSITLLALLTLLDLSRLDAIEFLALLVNITALSTSAYEAMRTLRELP